MSKLNKFLTKIGLRKEIIKIERIYYVKFEEEFGVGDVITADPEFGNQYVVTHVWKNLHELKELSNENVDIREFLIGNTFIKTSSIILDESFDIPINGGVSKSKVI